MEPEQHRADLPALFRALGNAERLAVFRAVAESDEGMSIAEVTAATGLERVVVSRHLKRLRLVGVLAARWDRRSHIHWMDVRALEQVEDWIYATLPSSNGE